MRKIAYCLALILIFILPWEDSISILSIGSIARLAGFVAAACWGATVLMEGRFRKPHFFHALVLLFFLWNFVSVFWSLNIENTIQRMKTYSQVFLLMLLYWDLFQGSEDLKAGLQAYVFGCYVLIISTIYNYINRTAAVVYEGRYSAAGTNANELSLLLIIGLPLAMQLFFTVDSSKVGKILKWINLAFIPLAIFANALSGTRTSIIAIIPFGLYVIGTQQISFLRKAVLSVLLVVSLLVLLPLLPQSVISRLGTIGSSIGEGDLGGRLELWWEGIDVMAQHPVVGIGSAGASSTVGSSVHNTFISIAVDTGIIGLVLFFAILGLVLYQALSLPKGSSALWLTVLAIWVIGVSTLSWEYRKLTWIVLSFVFIEGSFVSLFVAPGTNALQSRTPRLAS